MAVKVLVLDEDQLRLEAVGNLVRLQGARAPRKELGQQAAVAIQHAVGTNRLQALGVLLHAARNPERGHAQSREAGGPRQQTDTDQDHGGDAPVDPFAELAQNSWTLVAQDIAPPGRAAALAVAE